MTETEAAPPPPPSASDAAAAAASSSWSDEEIESLLATALAFAVITALAYWFVIRPVLGSKDGDDGGGGGGGDARPATANGVGAAAAAADPAAGGGGRGAAADPRRRTTAAAAARGSSAAAVATGGDDASDDGGGVSSVLARSSRRPPHLAPGAAGGVGASALLSEGVLPFRSTAASSHESRLAAERKRAAASKVAAAEPALASEAAGAGGTDGTAPGDGGGGGGGGGEDVVLSNRRERARLFTRLFSPAVTGAARGSVPPPRGSNVVVSVPADDADSVGCPRLRRALFLLGTYYGAFVVLVLPPRGEGEATADGDEDRLVQGLRDGLRGGGSASTSSDGDDCGLPREVLPDHRIVAVRSVTGRIAFVRQLSRPEFVLDFDPEVRAQLGRFGFTVLLYEAGGDDGKGGTSALGRALMP